MSMSKISMLMAAALVSAGLCAGEPAEAPKPECGGGKPAMRGGRRGPAPMEQRIQKVFQLNEEEKAALKASDDATKAQVKAIREKAQAEIKAVLEKAFDERIKTLKDAAARLTDGKDKAEAEKMIEMMEQRREQLIDMQAKGLLSGDRPGPGNRRGPRQGGNGPRQGGNGPRQGGDAPRGPRPTDEKQ